MDKKLQLADLAERLAQRQGLSLEKAEIFVRSFFDITEEGLLQDSYVKVTGFGTTKLVEVSERESVNVNTGERILIGSHAKVSFVPDVLLRDLVNAPFAFFTTTKLSDATTDEELEAVAEVDLEPHAAADEATHPLLDEAAPAVEISQSPVAAVEPVVVENSHVPAALESPATPVVVEPALPSEPEVVVASESIVPTDWEQRREVEVETTTVDHESGMPLIELAEDEVSAETAQPTAIVEEETPSVAPSASTIAPTTSIATQQQVAHIDLQAEKKHGVESRESTMAQANAAEITSAEPSAEITNIKGSIIVTSDQQQPHFHVHKWMIACFLLLILVFFLLGYLLGQHFGHNKPVVPTTTTPVKQELVVKPVSRGKATTPVQPPAAATKAATEPAPSVATDAAPKENLEPASSASQQSSQAAQQTVSSQAKATSSSASPASVDAKQLQQLPKGRYAIIGNLRSHTIGKGDNLYRLAAQVYGDQSFVSYIIVHNRIQNPDLIKAGQTIQLPRLAKKK